MVQLSALWLPIVLSAVFVFIALMILHMLPGWHKGDMAALPGEAKIMETLRGLGVQPGDYRFPFSNSTEEMKTPAWDEKMKQGPVGVLSILPSAPTPFGKMLGQWIAYSLFIGALAAYVAGSTHGPGAPRVEVFRVSATVALACYAIGHWHNWIWWGKSTRFTVTNSVDGIVYAVVTGATFAWLWPR